MIEQIYNYLNIKDSYQLPEKLMSELLYTDKREEFLNSLEYNEDDLDDDMFFYYFQEEHAERKKLKQDFTPPQISRILNDIALKDSDYIFEPTAGTGGILVEHWSRNKERKDEIFYVAEEISPRAIPMLLFNLTTRGMNGIVIHGDSLTREAEAVFLVDGQGKRYSDIKVMPYTKDVEEEFNIKFTSKPYIEFTEWHTRVYDLWSRLLTQKTGITKISEDDLDNYNLITVTNGKELVDIVKNKEEIKGEIIEVHEIKGVNSIARVKIKE